DYVRTLQALPEPMRSQFLYGDFSAGSEDDPWQVIPTEWVRQAMARWTETPPVGVPQSCLGVDVARGGGNKTVITRRYGSWFDRLRKYPGESTPDGQSVCSLVIRAHEGSAPVHVDVLGVGASVYDLLKEHRWFRTLGINNAESKVVHTMRDKS